MSHPQVLIFDLDGTLIDSAPDLHDAINVALAAQGRGPLDLATVTSFIGNGVETLVARSLAATGGADDGLHTRVVKDFLHAYPTDAESLTQLYPGVREFLGKMQTQGIPMGICTNKPQAPAEEICHQLGIARYFGTIHGARDGIVKKPEPTMLLNSIAALNSHPQHALYIGDSHIDQKTAQNAKVDFAFFEGGYLNGTLSGKAPLVRFGHWSEDFLSGL